MIPFRSFRFSCLWPRQTHISRLHHRGSFDGGIASEREIETDIWSNVKTMRFTQAHKCFSSPPGEWKSLEAILQAIMPVVRFALPSGCFAANFSVVSLVLWSACFFYSLRSVNAVWGERERKRCLAKRRNRLFLVICREICRNAQLAGSWIHIDCFLETIDCWTEYDSRALNCRGEIEIWIFEW